MRPLENPSTTRIIIATVMSLLGVIALTVASFHSLETVVFFWPSDPLRLLRLVLIFAGGVIFVASGAFLFHDNDWALTFITRLPLSVAGYAGVGVMSYVTHVYLHRSPSFATPYETTWFCVGLVTFLLAVHNWRPRKRHQKARGLTKR
jgi:hypothetical protein